MIITITLIFIIKTLLFKHGPNHRSHRRTQKHGLPPLRRSQPTRQSHHHSQITSSIRNHHHTWNVDLLSLHLQSRGGARQHDAAGQSVSLTAHSLHQRVPTHNRKQPTVVSLECKDAQPRAIVAARYGVRYEAHDGDDGSVVEFARLVD